MFKVDIKILQRIKPRTFENLALDIFKYQSKNNRVYASYLKLLNINPDHVKELSKVPFLPIELFKNQKVKSGSWKEETVFLSSGTTGIGQSRHYVQDLNFYKKISILNFQQFFGDLRKYQILALLPGYAESGSNSLITMISAFIEKSGVPGSDFFLNQEKKLLNILSNNPTQRKVLFGVSHALLDFATKHPVQLKNTLVMETGGMKGRRKEIIRAELHDILKKSFGVKRILSEYGMAELTSQGYSTGDGIFQFPPWMRIQIRDVTNPFQGVTKGKTGGINIIDLSNYQTCSFIETKDLGRLRGGKKVEILGRFDNSDIRGCNLLVI